MHTIHLLLIVQFLKLLGFYILLGEQYSLVIHKLLVLLFVLLLASAGLLCWTLALLGELALAQHRRNRAARERAAASKAAEQQTTTPTHIADPAEQLLQRRDDLRRLMQDLQGKLAQL